MALQGGNKVRVFFYNAGNYITVADYPSALAPAVCCSRFEPGWLFRHGGGGQRGRQGARVAGFGRRRFTDLGAFEVGDNPAIVVGSNFNSDNGGDLAVANTGSDTVSVLLFDGPTVHGEVVNNSSYRTDTTWFGQTTGYQFGDEIAIAGERQRIRVPLHHEFCWNTSPRGGGHEQLHTPALLMPTTATGYSTICPWNPLTYQPGTLLFDSGNVWLGRTTNVGAHTLGLQRTDISSTLKGVVVPTNFTWTVEFTGIGARGGCGVGALRSADRRLELCRHVGEGGRWLVAATIICVLLTSVCT